MKKIILDYRTSDEEKENLLMLGYNILLCPPSEQLYNAVCGHPDMLIHILNKENVVVHRDMPKEFTTNLSKLNINIMYSNSSLTTSYPSNIILNAVNTDNYFIHYLKYTDKTLLNLVEKNKKLINVKQGYTKCSTAVITSSAIITSDKGIAKSLFKENIDVLLLPPGDIELPGLNYGFIGGCCGLIEDNVLAFFGHLDYYDYKDKVLKFLKKHKVEPIFLRKGKLIDRGSILTLGI
ncbi:hypothetical protein OW763_00175 [Clostridium aestuarii]|uniref:DUF6873 domain-containing protein n=1 Tax=Clostridium aestuarii TaxID=338193 RepID=A0ABT4CUW7_9CLOT|nr:hypothetical protein [Clostridium aestuarii]MCY6482773.1 hypothetical protein [Clostridium aestuarii]